jgi:hypothetical protein
MVSPVAIAPAAATPMTTTNGITVVDKSLALLVRIAALPVSLGTAPTGRQRGPPVRRIETSRFRRPARVNCDSRCRDAHPDRHAARPDPGMICWDFGSGLRVGASGRDFGSGLRGLQPAAVFSLANKLLDDGPEPRDDAAVSGDGEAVRREGRPALVRPGPPRTRFRDQSPGFETHVRTRNRKRFPGPAGRGRGRRRPVGRASAAPGPAPAAPLPGETLRKPLKSARFQLIKTVPK